MIRSRIVRYMMISSGASGSARFMAPAARLMGMTKERRP